jgi:hypothetical protein
MPILSKATNVVMKDFLKAISTHIDRFKKAIVSFMKKSAKNCQPQQISEARLIGDCRLSKTVFISALAAF